jgi:serine/threonine-protein kinase
VPNSDAEIDGYVVERPSGRGGNATVYVAHRPPAGAPVALKVLDADHREQADTDRLRREFRFARQFDHPHIVKVYECGRHWLAMQLVDGGDAGTLAALGDRLAALTQIAEALDLVHRLGVVHCDVKPSNILVFKDFALRGAVLTDFGVAHSLAEDIGQRLSRCSAGLSLDPAKRITDQGAERPAMVQASLSYAPPELLLGRMPSAASDIYALACTAVELVTGEPPFPATTPIALMYAQLHQLPPRLSERHTGIPHAFDSVVAKALAKQPEVRYASCTEFVAALTQTLR